VNVYDLNDKGSTTGRGKIFLFHSTSRLTVGKVNWLHWCTGGYSAETKRPKRHSGHSPPYNAEVRKASGFRSITTICVQEQGSVYLVYGFSVNLPSENPYFIPICKLIESATLFIL
jgi:hypothetical protein